MNLSFTNPLPIFSPSLSVSNGSPLALSLLMYSRFQKVSLSLRERQASWGQLAAPIIITRYLRSPRHTTGTERGEGKGGGRERKSQIR